MFTMAKIKDGSTYLGQHLCANDYYSENESVSGRWVGRAAEKLDLCGKIHVGDTAFEALRSNRHPETGAKLTPRDGEDRIRFYDFQCSAQKSVSIMAVTLGDERLLYAHDEAANVALGELEKFAATQANTAWRRENRITGNLVAAAFRHTASRALDPQVHTHFVTANATWDETARSWRALTEYEMLRAIRYAGKVYQNEMASSCRRLGYGLIEVRDERGRTTGFELSGVSAELRERFSKRRAEVEKGISQFREKHGRTPTTAEVHAITVATRNVKLAEATTSAVLADQRAQLSAAEWMQLSSLKQQSETRTARESPTALPPRERESLRLATGHLFERRSVAAGHEILAEALNQNLGYVELARLHAQAARTNLVALTKQPWLRAQFATVRGLALERWAVTFVERTQGRFAELGCASDASAGRLSSEQQRALRAVLASRDQVVCLRGAAGVGKTTVLKELQTALAADGRSVYYGAPTSSAAETLREGGLVHATTVSDFLQNVAGRERARLNGAIFVIDEAGLASNQQGAAILRLAERHGARVVFLGDSKQHTAVEAGDFLRILETHAPLHCVALTDIRRQQVAEYRDAVRAMALGSARAGLERLDQFGWVHEGGADYLRAAVAEFLRKADHGRRLDAVMAVTPTWVENHAFTAMLRSQLKTCGALGAGETMIAHEPLAWTHAQKARAANYTPGLIVTFNRSGGGFSNRETATVARVESDRVWVATGGGERPLALRRGQFEVARVRPVEVCVGDKLLIRANDRGAGLINGEILKVTAVRGGVINTAEGRLIDSQSFRHFTHGFAVTSHRSQSKTAEHVVVAAERLDAKATYVACSRGRLSCAVHTPDKTALLECLPDGQRTAALDVAALTRTHAASFSRAAGWENAERVGREDRNRCAEVQRALGHRWWRDLMQEAAAWYRRVLPGRRVDGTTEKDATTIAR